MLVINLLVKLSSGWRPKNKNVDSVCESSSHIWKQFKVEGLFVVCTIDIIKELRYMQVLKVWDILALEEIPKLVKRLDGMFAMYTDDFIKYCNEKQFEGDFEVPLTWVKSFDIPRFKNLGNHELGNMSSVGIIDGRSYVENSKVKESLSLMKFYSLSSGMVSHLLSDDAGRELDLPFEVTDEELELIQFPRSSFILGSTATDVSHRTEVDECIVDTKDTIVGTKESVFRQLFCDSQSKIVFCCQTTSCWTEKVCCWGNFSEEDSSIDMDYTTHFKDIPDSFLDIPSTKYPLVITFHKFLMMLDGTLGSSYFERFLSAELSHCNTRSSRSVALETFIRTKEVNYERFCSLYWPHLNSELTKKLDPSRVYTEIISHIKGQRERELYSIFQDYEKMKMEKGEFDLSDLVNDLHSRLRNERFDGEEMDFVYIDEVQDLTMRQISLFKYICRNMEEGFVFAGDTAQTIARGIDFRFEDIRTLFYDEFLVESRGDVPAGRKEKGHVSKIGNLKQNFRTHDGVLRLAQSVIDLLYRFFRHSIDVLDPEKSLICGEAPAPVLLEPGNDENAILTIFGKSGNVSGNIVGFGAEQVILVRDDRARQDISVNVGKQALVLTIVECKGLEFQDVLLYNFFGSSPLKTQWRVIYEFMKEQDLLDATIKSFPNFNEARHNVLCSELKQLYVAITRTRQRLWICEDVEEFSKPMFEYWKKRGLVQVKRLDDSLAQAMQVASSPEEWKARGIKLFHENNYVPAMVCFEKANEPLWEKRAKAAYHRASADRMRGSNPEGACKVLREAADIFDSIGDTESAAQCFCDLGEYERAGKIYLEKCGKSELDKAGECFLMAGCYELAAEVYAKGNYFSECLSACNKGKLFNTGLKYIQYWKEHAPKDSAVVKRSKEIDQIEQRFLESCANNCYELKDNRSMMKFVRAFNAMDSRRNFLKSLNCLDELLLLEEESGNFLEAAEIVKLRGDILLEADLLGKAGRFKEASMLILWYVFSNSMWASRSRGWPLKHFPQRDEILVKTKSFAKKESDFFYEFVCTEVTILSNEETNLFTLNQYKNASQKHKSLRGEILSLRRRILDIHLHSNASKYEWEDELAVDLIKPSEERISGNNVSVGTLVCFWNLWKEKVENIFEYLSCLETQDANNYINYGEFCLNYFGVRRQLKNMNISYVLVNSDADWVREIDDRFLRRSEKLVSVDARQFVSAARIHWRSELLSVGLKVLDALEALHQLSIKNSMSLFCQSTPLIYIFEPSDKTYKKIAERFEGNLVWREFVVDLSGNTESENLQESASDKVHEIPIQVPLVYKFHNALKDTYNANWRVQDYISPHCFLYLVESLLILGSCFQGIIFTSKSSFVEWLISEQPKANRSGSSVPAMNVIFDFIAHLINQFLCDKQGTTEWIENSNINVNYYYPLLRLRLVVILCLLCMNSGRYFDMLFHLLGRGDITSCLPRAFCDVFRRSRKQVNAMVLAEAFMKIQNPLVIVSLGENGSKFKCPDAIFVDMATQSREAIIGVLFPMNNKTPRGKTVVSKVDTTNSCSREFPSSNDREGKTSKATSSNLASLEDPKMNSQNKNEGNLEMKCGLFQEISDALKSVETVGDGNVMKFVSSASKIKVELMKSINFIPTALAKSFEKKTCDGEDGILLAEANSMLDELKELSSLLGASDRLEN
ncbi:hypothetical protein Acr_07g0012090 [Actinidia rufa]|uniref:UvrD-like helicase ATP-binding domain-containing protein n=1 Tax=Actinidia rufa TaxID=165716 RepID=A0A7J0EX97_9ERIC|nr:hypothetical protein Acr_07g0012090 [Actinidia rufa]